MVAENRQKDTSRVLGANISFTRYAHGLVDKGEGCGEGGDSYFGFQATWHKEARSSAAC